MRVCRQRTAVVATMFLPSFFRARARCGADRSWKISAEFANSDRDPVVRHRRCELPLPNGRRSAANPRGEDVQCLSGADFRFAAYREHWQLPRKATPLSPVRLAHENAETG